MNLILFSALLDYIFLYLISFNYRAKLKAMLVTSPLQLRDHIQKPFPLSKFTSQANISPAQKSTQGQVPEN